MRNIFKRVCAEGRHRRRLCGAVVFALGALGTALSVGAAPAGPEAPASAIHRITIETMAFSPASVTIRRGDRVIFENRDLLPHTATAKGPGGFDSGVIQKERTWSVTLTERGTVRYTCLLHPTMTGAIIVGE